MSKSNESGDDLDALLADVLVADTLDDDLLMRYSADPNALEPAERQKVDRYLAASPAHRQQLRSLVLFAETRSELMADTRSKSGGGSEEAALTAISSHPRWRTRSVFLAAALAASLLAALLYGRQGGIGTGGGPDTQYSADGSSASDSPAPLVGGVPVPEASPDRSEQEQETQLAGQGEEDFLEGAGPGRLDDAAPVPIPEPVLAEAASPPPPIPPISKPAPVPAPRRGERVEPEAVPVEEESREPILLAMNVAGPLAYARPERAIELGRLGGLRDARPGLLGVQALVPDHVARTSSASPSLFFYLSGDTDRPIEFVLADRVSIDPLLELKLEPPLAAGIHGVELAQHGVVLTPGQEYRWFVRLDADEGAGSEDVVARGAVFRIEPSDELVSALADAPPGERGRILAERGLWYDALAFISASIDRDPEDRRLRELRAGLLDDGGLSAAAEYERRD